MIAKNRKTLIIILLCLILVISIGVITVISIVTRPTVKRVLPISMQNVTVISDNANLKYELPTDPINVYIEYQGSVDKLSEIINDYPSLRATLDISGLSSGTHDVELHFDLPRNVSVANSPVKVRVVISEEP